MKKTTLFLISFLAINIGIAQEKLTTRTGKVIFQSETAIETFSAENNQAASILLVDKKVIAFNVLLKSFKFEKALMEDHFNEKYVNSDKYPAAKFKGSFTNEINFKTPNTYKGVIIRGNMNFHGVTKPLTVIADIKINDDNSISFLSTFKLNLEEYNIEIPSLVKDKISPDVAVSIETNYKRS
ncbi:MAG: YceI family protein [Flavobacteriaceae bacterium]|nr:YceI family protein [Flavobacteriaceae bacterium]